MKIATFISALLAVLLVGYSSLMAADPTVKVGLSSGLISGSKLDSGIDKLNDEFFKYHPSAAYMTARQIKASLFDNQTLVGRKGSSTDWTESEQEAILRRYHLLHLMFWIDSSGPYLTFIMSHRGPETIGHFVDGAVFLGYKKM